MVIYTMINLAIIEGFDWDEGNVRKNEKHGVTQQEAEEIFFNEPLIVADDVKHSLGEKRYQALGITNGGRRLHSTFTLRRHDTLIRIISARDMSRKERGIYDEEA